MFTETITHTDGETGRGSCSADHARSLLLRAVRRGFTVEATRKGGVVITRTVHTGSVIPKQHVVALEPLQAIGRISPTQHAYLDAIAQGTGYRVDTAYPPFRYRIGRIQAAPWCAVPPAAAARLFSGGLVIAGDVFTATSNGCLPETRTPVYVPLSARLAVHARDHRTITHQPNGYVRPADIGMNSTGLNRPGRRNGLVYDRASWASCSCGNWSTWAESCDVARMKAAGHRQEATAAFVATME